MIGHLDRDARRALWQLLAHRLAPGAPALVELIPPFTPEPVPATLVTTVALGASRLEGWMQAEPAGPDRLSWTMTYRVARGEEPLEEQVVRFDWHTAAPDTVIAEAAAAGLTADRPADGLLVLRSTVG